ncbi:hypothetical protein ACROYT_G010292 [Oculina patagonica]
MNVDVKREDIDICHRIKRKKSNPIIVRFISHKVKRALYKQRVKLKNISGSQLFPSAPATARPSSNRIFVNENLTAHRRNLVRMANDMKQDGILKGVWTVDGKIFVKTSPEDIQRVHHPNLNIYSYVSKALNVKSRLDFILIAKNLTKHVKSIGITNSIAPDHKTVFLCLSLPNNSPRGPGFWKFNNTLLKDDSYIFKIRDLIPRLREEYASLKDKRLVWELIKMEIRDNTISFAKRKARAALKREVQISKRLEELDHEICNSDNLSDIENTLNEYDNLKTEFQSIYEEKGRAAIFRSKCRWVEKGERPTKYFFNLEKRNYNRKTITELQTRDNVTIKEEVKILQQIEKFYEDLYSSKTTVTQEAFDEFIRGIEIPELSNEEQEQMEGIFTLEEYKRILESFEDNKSPGEDGFTAEFYKHFFDLIGLDLIQSLNQAFKDGELSISQRRGVITLIPKEDSDLLDIQNWRPITLLNIDYKIAFKALAKRIESVLPKLVHSDQTGFMKGRYIGENIRLINDVMEYTMSEKKGGILVSLDFKKAFDILEWQFIMKRRGVITLIPKEDSDLLDIQNWRPITLLNIDYKIAFKALAKRIESVLPKLVHSDQTGFMKGRYIGENIRLINDVMEYTMSEKKGGILVSLDFKKAFDILEWQFIMK